MYIYYKFKKKIFAQRSFRIIRQQNSSSKNESLNSGLEINTSSAAFNTRSSREEKENFLTITLPFDIW